MSTPRQDDMDGLILANDLLREENEKLKEQVFIQDAYLFDYKLTIGKLKTKLKIAENALYPIAIGTQNTPLITDGMIKSARDALLEITKKEDEG